MLEFKENNRISVLSIPINLNIQKIHLEALPQVDLFFSLICFCLKEPTECSYSMI